MSDTPITDTEARKLEQGIAYAKGEYVSAHLSRKFERELAAAQARIKEMTEVGIEIQNERLAVAEASDKDMRGFHHACIVELYKMLGIDGGDGEFRFKWVALELSDKLRKLAHYESDLEIACTVIRTGAIPPEREWTSDITRKSIERVAELHAKLARFEAAKMPEFTAEQIARLFHETYERLAPSFGYETRPDTKAFDPATPNGKLMTAVCGQVTESFRTFAAAETVRADENERDARRLKHLHDDPKRAQAYFWNHQGRKERNAAIDSALKEQKT